MHRILIIYILLIIFGCDKSSDITKSDIIGCMDETACNYQVTATINDNCVYNDCSGTCNGDKILDCAGICGGDTTIEECNSCDGNIDECGICDNDPTNNCIWDINYNFFDDIGGFQFDVIGAQINNSLGGASEEFSFSVSSSPSTVLGFSFSGAVIPYGEGILIQLEINGDINDACIINPVISDPSGYGIDVRIENCNTIIQNETL